MIRSINIDAKLMDKDSHRSKVLSMSTVMLKSVQSQEFKDEILGMDRKKWLKGESKTSKFRKEGAYNYSISHEDNYLSNEEIYKKFMSGAEEWNNIADNEIDIQADNYYTIKGVYGFINPGRKTVYLNTRLLMGLSDKKLCSLLLHEWGHTMGTRHSGEFFRLSLSYLINKIIEGMRDYTPVSGVSTTTTSEDKESEPRLETVCYKRRWFLRWLGPKCYTKVVR